MSSESVTRRAIRFDRQRFADTADWLAVAAAGSLPWSTSATGILIVCWLIALIPTLTWTDVRREIMTPAGGLPVLLFLLGLIGMAWADVSLAARFDGLKPFLRLLVVPLLLVQFRRTGRAHWVFAGYVCACIALLVVSYGLATGILPIWMSAGDFGVPVKSAPTQSGEFVTCTLGLIYLAHRAMQERQWAWFAGLCAVTLAFLGNLFFVATGRTALVVLLVILPIFALKRLSLHGNLAMFATAVVVVATAWFTSPYLRERSVQVWTDFQQYQATDERNSSGERIEFAKKSIRFIAEAPVIGHGTGTIHELFTKSAVGQSGASAVATTNPHNQTFTIGIQLGLIGIALLWAMWVAHAALFLRASGLIAWVGLVVVLQNVVGSLFNSHLFDFVQGWTYIVGMGVAGGAVLRARSAPNALKSDQQ